MVDLHPIGQGAAGAEISNELVNFGLHALIVKAESGLTGCLSEQLLFDQIIQH